MCPRPYQLGKRQEQVDQRRGRVVDAARALLAEATSYGAFTVDAVATRADVARATVYYQFGSKAGLLEALCDALAEAGQLSMPAAAFTIADPLDALDAFVARFAHLWGADRPVMRGLRGLAALDPEVAAVIAAREEARREGLADIVSRLSPPSGVEGTTNSEETVRVLHALTSFETFDALAGTDRELTDVTALVVALTRAVTR